MPDRPGNKRKPRGSFDESPPSRGLSRPTKSNPKALLMLDSGIVPKIFAVAPRHRGTPSARRLWGVSPSARRPEGPRPARSFRTQQERLRFFSCESIRRSFEGFPPFVRCLEVSLQAQSQCRPWNRARVRVWLPKFREWLVTFREKDLVRKKPLSSPRFAKSNPCSRNQRWPRA